jgi:hypothetical protein
MNTADGIGDRQRAVVCEGERQGGVSGSRRKRLGHSAEALRGNSVQRGSQAAESERRVGRGLLYVLWSDLTRSYCSNGSESLFAKLTGWGGREVSMLDSDGGGEEGREMEPGTDALTR